MPEIKRNEIFF